MAMGIAGFFIDKDGQRLGEMKMRDATLKFVIYPRPETYAGPLAILLAERLMVEGLAASSAVAVPLHSERARSRGFNQSALLVGELRARMALSEPPDSAPAVGTRTIS